MLGQANEGSYPVALPEARRGIWQNKWVRIALKALFAIGMGALAVTGKNTSLGLGITGHSALLWLTPLLLSRIMIGNRGSATVSGVSTALIGSYIGIKPSLLTSPWMYGLTGLAVDLIAMAPKINPRHPLGAVVVGAGAHMVKFAYKVGEAFLSGATTNWLLRGVAESAFMHLVWGAAAGVIAWSIYRGVDYARSKLSK